jgi:hypothetical protein
MVSNTRTRKCLWHRPQRVDIYSRQRYRTTVGNTASYSACHSYSWSGYNREPLCDIRKYTCQKKLQLITPQNHIKQFSKYQSTRIYFHSYLRKSFQRGFTTLMFTAELKICGRFCNTRNTETNVLLRQSVSSNLAESKKLAAQQSPFYCK